MPPVEAIFMAADSCFSIASMGKCSKREARMPVPASLG